MFRRQRASGSGKIEDLGDYSSDVGIYSGRFAMVVSEVKRINRG
jgi:hypothetical protein